MGVRYTIEGDLLTLWLEGSFETEDLVRAGLDARADPALPRPFRLLFDLTESRMSAAHAEIVERVEQLAAYKGEFVPRVAVVVRDDLHHGLTRIHDGYASAEGIEIRPFRIRADALAWIDAPCGSEDPLPSENKEGV